MATGTKSASLDEEAIRKLNDEVEGSVTLPEDANYDEARSVWNGVIDRHPALILRCINEDDVITGVNFARENDLLLSVRGGGHNVAGHGSVDGGLVIDLERLHKVVVDPDARSVKVQGGATLGEMDAATQQHGLAVPAGVVSQTGIAGLTLGGGYGWLRNKYGLTCDSLVAAEVVTADGRLVRASETENSDLLWGLRGGGGNFGVVTTFEFRAYSVGPEVMFVFVLHDGSDGKMAEAIKFFREYAQTAPEEVAILMVAGMIPPDEAHFPKEIHLKPYAAYLGMYAGDPEEGKKVLQSLIEFGEPLLDFSEVMPYVEAQQALDEEYADGMRYYWKSINLPRLDDEMIDKIVAHSLKQPSPLSTVDIWHVGVAMQRTSAEESAFFGREAAFLLSPEANWEEAEDDEANIAWLRAFIDEMEPYSDGSRYLNFAGFQEEGDEMMRRAFGSQYERLVALKNKYDPGNLFQLNQNIKPTS